MYGSKSKLHFTQHITFSVPEYEYSQQIYPTNLHLYNFVTGCSVLMCIYEHLYFESWLIWIKLVKSVQIK